MRAIYNVKIVLLITLNSRNIFLVTGRGNLLVHGRVFTKINSEFFPHEMKSIILCKMTYIFQMRLNPHEVRTK